MGNLKRPIVSFVVLSNIIFWPLFCLVGLTIVLEAPSNVSHLALCIASWSSTFAFIILFKKFYPGKSLRGYVKEQFAKAISIKEVVSVVTIQTVIWGIMISQFGLNKPEQDVFLIGTFFLQLLAGPLGEELGWRSYMLNTLQEKYTPLKAALINGLWWGLWHLPIWFTTGLTGIALIKYMIAFMLGIIAVSIFMTTFYSSSKNLVIPIIIHQLFNFMIVTLNGEETQMLNVYTALYCVVAIVCIIVDRKRMCCTKKSVTR